VRDDNRYDTLVTQLAPTSQGEGLVLLEPQPRTLMWRCVIGDERWRPSAQRSGAVRCLAGPARPSPSGSASSPLSPH